jgi:hypothetical protein
VYQHTDCSTKQNISCNNHRKYKNHNHPLILFSTPQPVANHPKGKNEQKMLKNNTVSKSKALQPVREEVSRKKKWDNR